MEKEEENFNNPLFKISFETIYSNLPLLLKEYNETLTIEREIFLGLKKINKRFIIRRRSNY
jgi:hypothetical protein